MHEVNLMQRVLNKAVERAQEEGAQHIRMMQLKVGEASGMEPHSLEQAFELVKQGTMAEGAHLQINKIPTVCYCSYCNLEFHPISDAHECLHCHRPSHEILQGKEFQLDFLEVS